LATGDEQGIEDARVNSHVLRRLNGCLFGLLLLGLSANGNWIWTRQAGSAAPVALDSQPSAGGDDLFVMKFKSDWSKR